MNDTGKHCSTCGQFKYFSEFHKDNRTMDGFRGRCKECRVDESRKDREAHHETRIHSQKQWAENNKDRCLKNHKSWRDKNKDKIRTYQQSLIKKGTWKEIQDRRYARKHAAEIVDFTKADWEMLIIEFNNRCAYCGSKGKLEREHVVPISKGGNHTYANIVPACRICNATKGDRTPEEAGMKFYDWRDTNPTEGS